MKTAVLSVVVVLLSVGLAFAAAPTCSSYKKRCYASCDGHQLEGQCRAVLCDRAFAKCMRTGIWHTRGYVRKTGMRRR